METFESKIEGFDNLEMPEDTDVVPEKKKRPVVLIILGIVAAFALLAGALFVASRFINPETLRGGPGVLLWGGPGVGQRVSMRFEMERAEELPDTTPELTGQLSRRDDNSLYVNPISEGMQSGVAIQSGGGEAGGGEIVQSSSPPGGPEVEVVITADTVIYHDITTPPDPGKAGGEQTIKQAVERVDTLDGIGADSILQVWGEKRGDRLIASVVFYSSPFVISVPAR